MLIKSVQDAIYNWLSIRVVYDARPDDLAAKATSEHFEELLESDHHVKDLTFDKNDDFYTVTYTVNQEEKTQRFPVELIDVMINQINNEPEKYPIFKE